jgi:hypothetical protein
MNWLTGVGFLVGEKPSPGFVSSRERRWVWAFALIVMLITTLPYLLAYSAQGEEYRFTGFVFGVEDGNSYIAKMLSGSYGAWLFRSPYSAYPQQGAPIFLPYILLGKLASPPGLHVQLVAIYHLFRFIAGLVAILATYDFLAFFLVSERTRRFGLALAVLGGGLGWILVLIGQDQWLNSLPLDFYSPESFGFLGMYGVPHLAMARALLLLALLEYLKWAAAGGQVEHRGRAVLKLSGLWLLAGLMQPLVSLIIGVVIAWHLVGVAIWQAARARRGRSTEWDVWRRLAGMTVAAGVFPGLLVLINAWLVMRDPFLTAWTAQNVIRSPHPAHYLLAYGLVLPYAWLGGKRLLQTAPWRGWLPVGWVILLPLLAYAPVDLQRRLPEGVWVAWVALALAALDVQPAEVLQIRPRLRLIPYLPLLLAFPSTLFLLAGGLIVGGRPGLPAFRPTQEVQAFEYLAENARDGEVIVTSFATGNPLPAWAPLRVLVGHGPESANLEELLLAVGAFYTSGTPDAERLALIEQFDVDYVFWGPAERAVGDWTPSQAAYLDPIYRQGEYEIFKVVTAR